MTPRGLKRARHVVKVNVANVGSPEGTSREEPANKCTSEDAGLNLQGFRGTIVPKKWGNAYRGKGPG